MRELVEANGPYAPVQRYFANAAEYGALSGEKSVEQMFVAPVFRGDWAFEGKPLIEGVGPVLHHEGLRDAAARLFGGSVVRPYAVYSNLTWQLPFPQGAGHTDIPAFRGIDRSRHPVWLLSAMGHSRLFEDERIRIATAVAWFYAGADGGFDYWPQGVDSPPVVHEGAIQNTALLGDNDLMYHRVRPVGDPKAGIVQGMTLESRLERVSGDAWRITESGRELAAFPFDALRISVSWKAYVFQDATDAARADEGRDALTTDTALERLYTDLAARGLDFRRPAEPLHDPDFVRLVAQTYMREPGRA